MKRNVAEGISMTLRLEKNGAICLPQLLTKWEIGQRIFFSIADGGILATAKPKGSFNGRILSSRVSRRNRKIAATILIRDKLVM